MDVCESKQPSQKQSASDQPRLPLVPAENKNGITPRYQSPAPSSPTAPKRSPSPFAPWTPSTSTPSAPKRATSVGRRRPSRASSPIQDTNAEMVLTSRKVAGNKLQESLWPSTMRVSSDVHKQAEIHASRKPSPVKGKTNADQSENSRPSNSLNPRVVEQHRWPSRATDKTPSLSHAGTGKPSNRRLSLDGIIKPLIKSTSDLFMLISRDESGKARHNGCSLDDSSLQREKLGSPALHPVSTSVSPAQTKGVNPSSSVHFPAQVRPASPTRRSQSSTSFLSFITGIKPVKKVANHVEDAHQLRLLYNRHLQWRYANAYGEAALQSQKEDAEKMLYNVWMTNADLSDSITEKRIVILQLRLKLKLYSVLSNQLSCLDKWASIETDHVNLLTWVVQDLQAKAIRVPFTRGATGDIETVKAALCSTVDVMQAIGSSLCAILSREEGLSSLLSKLADLSLEERALLDECESLLGSTVALQVEENSLRTQILQRKQARKVG